LKRKERRLRSLRLDGEKRSRSDWKIIKQKEMKPSRSKSKNWEIRLNEEC